MRTAATILVSLALACGGDDDDAEPGLSHAEEIQPIWDERCIGENGRCHGGTSMTDCSAEGCWGIPRLDAGQAYDRLVDHFAVQPSNATETLMDYVEPGSPDDSYLMLKLRGDHLDVGSGVRMPCHDIDPTTLECTTDADPLPQAELDLVEQWIREGAWE